MTMEYQNTGDAGELERGDSASAETADLQETPEPSLEDRLSALLDARLSPLERRVQSFTDRTANLVSGLEQRIEALRGQFGDTAEIREMLTDLHDANLDDNEKELKRLQRAVAKTERERQQAAPTQPATGPQPTQAQTADGGWGEWPQHAEELAEYGQLRGFSKEDMAADDWMPKLHGAGLASDGYATVWEYKAAVKAAMGKLAQQKRAATRGRTATPNPATAGSGGPRNYGDVAVKDIPNDQFEKDFRDIAAAVVAKNRR